MRPSALLPTLLALTLAGGARAGGLALRWDHCHGEGTGVAIRSFACDTNAGSDRIVGSFVTDRDLSQVVGLQILVDVSTCPFVVGDPCPSTLPAWWQFYASGTCRRTSLTMDLANDPANTVCESWTPGALGGGIASYTVGYAGPQTARLVAASAVAPADSGRVYAGHEYTAFTLVVDHQKTVGTGACGGCDQPLGLYVTSIDVIANGGADHELVGTPLGSPADDIVYWQSAPVPVRASTWAGVKALYR